MDLERHTVIDGGQEVKLTAKEFLLLQYLLQHRGRVPLQGCPARRRVGLQVHRRTRTVDVHVRRLREKLPVLVDAL
jgi:DNA-binding response OmpR family regulator